MDIVFVHGWGFGPDIWHPLSGHLNGNHHYINLEFIEGFAHSDTIPDTPVVIAHSLGVLWALKNIPHPAAFISIAGFKNFTSHRPVSALRAMRRQLRSDPGGLMAGFWTECATPLTYDVKRLNGPRLAEGLDWLTGWNAAVQKIDCPVLPFAAKNDTILSKNTTLKEWRSVHWSNDGGHMLPLNKPQWCAKTIEGFLYDLDPQGNYSG